MIELDACKQLWRDRPEAPPPNPLSKEELMTVIHAKTTDIRARALERVRQEGQTYIVLVVVLSVMLLTRYGITWRAGVGIFAVLALLGIILAALLQKQHQLRTLPLAGSLRESLVALLATLSATTRLYMVAYMASIVIPVAALAAFLVWSRGFTPATGAGVVAGVAFLVWCYRSGRAYLLRMFGHYRAELAECLKELQAA